MTIEPPEGSSTVVEASRLRRPSRVDDGKSTSFFLPRIGQIVPAEITIFQDGSFTFVLKTSPAADLLKKAAGIKSGSAVPNREKVGKITRKQAEEIAKTKMPDLTAADMDAAVRTIAGSARSMGITVEGV